MTSTLLEGKRHAHYGALKLRVAACAATLALRGKGFEGRVQPATFTVPLGPVVPAAAILISVALIAGATRPQLLGGAAALGAGAALYWLNRGR